MRRFLLAAGLAFALGAVPAAAQPTFPTTAGNVNAPGFVIMCQTGAGTAVVPCGSPGALPLPVVVLNQANPPYPPGAIPITGNGTGTTGAVVGTLAGIPGRTTYICGLVVAALGGTATIGPITVAGLVTSSMVFQMASTATGNVFTVPFTPCIPASAANTAITITTTADGTASAVDVNSWGFQL